MAKRRQPKPESAKPHQFFQAYLPVELVNLIKVRVLLEGKTTNEIVEAALRAYLGRTT